jgi:O-antigen ligase
MFKKIWHWSLLVFLFLLPWQTRWIYGPAYLNGNFWEYGSLSWYATELLLWFTIIMFAIEQFFFHHNWPHLFGKIHFRAHFSHLLITLGFVGFLLLEVFHSTNVTLSYNFVFHVLEGLCLFIVIASAAIPKQKLMLALWSGGVLQSILGLVQFFTQHIGANKWLGLAYQSPAQLGSFVIETHTERWLRAYGSFGSPNIFGAYLALMLVIGLLLYVKSKPWHKIIYTLGQAFILLGLIFSFSRGAWISATLGLFTYGSWLVFEAFMFRHRPFWSRMRPVGLFLKQLIFYAIIVAFASTLFQSLFAVRFDPSYRLEQRSITERLNQYAVAGNLIKQYPFLGIGPEVYTLKLFENNPLLNVWDLQPVHNVWLLILAEWGIVGFVIWLAVFIMIGKKMWAENMLYCGLFVTLIVASFFDHFWWSMYVGQMLWWVVMGLIFLPKNEV